MSEDITLAVPPLSYLRRPKFGPDDVRRPRAAILNALPAFLFMAFNVWFTGVGLALFFVLSLSLPIMAAAILLAAVAVPCCLISWGLFVHCAEVEATLTI